MKLATVITLQFGGPGSGCHGENCGRPKAAFDLAKRSVAKKLAKIDKKLAVAVILKSARLSDRKPSGLEGGYYNRKTRSIEIFPKAAAVLGFEKVIQHEIGHYLEHQHEPFVTKDHPTKKGFVLLNQPNSLLHVAAVVHNLSLSEKEFKDAKNGDHNYLGSYSKTNHSEWMAEAFHQYIHNRETNGFLKEHLPATYVLLDGFVSGRFLKKTDKVP